MAALGHDGGAVRERFANLGIATDGVRTIDETFTAQAFIITDLDDNQITAFHPGRDEPFACEPRRRTSRGVGLGIIAPDGKEGMMAHVARVR